MGFQLWEEEAGKKDLRVVVELSLLFQVFVKESPVLIQVLRRRG